MGEPLSRETVTIRAVRAADVPLQTTLRPRLPVDLGLTLWPLRRGAGDPCMRAERSGAWWRATRTPMGPATARYATRGAEVEVIAWGPGAEWCLQTAPELLGLRDSLEGFAPQGLVARLHHEMPGLRISRSLAVFEALVPSILEQKVAGAEARAAYRGIVRAWGAPAPGPWQPGPPGPPEPGPPGPVPPGPEPPEPPGPEPPWPPGPEPPWPPVPPGPVPPEPPGPLPPKPLPGPEPPEPFPPRPGPPVPPEPPEPGPLPGPGPLARANGSAPGWASRAGRSSRNGTRSGGLPPLRVPPAPEVLAAKPYWEFHPLGVEMRRANTIRTAAVHAAAVERTVTLDPTEAQRRLRTLPGVGLWTSAEVAIVALGDADAVSVGDYHLPHLVSWALAGEPRGSDERMLELLAPYNGHRGRVLRLLTHSGLWAPRFGPRMPLRSFTRF
jgi:3-methyladenine DNA glycosylase/8-oxoguanine DNA glycosylase